jgi:hypothetical protein
MIRSDADLLVRVSLLESGQENNWRGKGKTGTRYRDDSGRWRRGGSGIWSKLLNMLQLLKAQRGGGAGRARSSQAEPWQVGSRDEGREWGFARSVKSTMRGCGLARRIPVGLFFTSIWANPSPCPLPSSSSRRTPCSETETLTGAPMASLPLPQLGTQGDRNSQDVTQDKDVTAHSICYMKMFLRKLYLRFGLYNDQQGLLQHGTLLHLTKHYMNYDIQIDIPLNMNQRNITRSTS